MRTEPEQRWERMLPPMRVASETEVMQVYVRFKRAFGVYLGAHSYLNTLEVLNCALELKALGYVPVLAPRRHGLFGIHRREF